ncbi:chemotactic signal-response protein CheL [Devosia sp. LC5]|uniref:rod-binding protein n=1 Tax=Devosia sp. LC5 TaxID=1502724 RepID=UPI0004E42D85|nr:rod-binding protein [Devosia sp. LC5]KFC69119.1 chemotactic signal-response protein CheL [Devosia sp. LC5]
MVEAIAKPGSTLSASQIAKVRQQAEEFEGVFLNTLTKTMFESVKSENGFGSGFGEETWRSMQSEQLANSMAQNGGLGIADQLMGDLLTLQEAANAQNSLTIPKGAY